MADLPPMPGDEGLAGVGSGLLDSGAAFPGGVNPILLLAIGGAVAYFHWKFKGKGGDEVDEDDEDEQADEEDEHDDDDDSDDDDSHHEIREINLKGLRKRRLSDVTTDSLIDEPAIIAGRGKPGDCYKAVKLLKSRSGLAQSKRERGLYSKVARAVSHDCAHADEEIERAVQEDAERRIEDEEEIREEVDDILGVRRRGERHEPGWAPRGRGASTRGVLHEPGMRKSKSGREHLKTTVEHGDSRSKGRGRSGRPGAAAIRVKRKSGEQFRLRKEKAKTKRGYTWRREE